MIKVRGSPAGYDRINRNPATSQISALLFRRILVICHAALCFKISDFIVFLSLLQQYTMAVTIGAGSR
jgi:hypothetical protein